MILTRICLNNHIYSFQYHNISPSVIDMSKLKEDIKKNVLWFIIKFLSGKLIHIHARLYCIMG